MASPGGLISCQIVREKTVAHSFAYFASPCVLCIKHQFELSHKIIEMALMLLHLFYTWQLKGLSLLFSLSSLQITQGEVAQGSYIIFFRIFSRLKNSDQCVIALSFFAGHLSRPLKNATVIFDNSFESSMQWKIQKKKSHSSLCQM